MRSLTQHLKTAVLVAAACLLAACSSPPPFKSKPVPESPLAPPFTLTDQQGLPRSLGDFKGKVVSLFFGFTHCPDICPTHLARQAEVMRQLGPQADQVAVLFVSLDPERDSPEALQRYMEAFNPRFIALTGSPEETSKVAKQYKIFWQKTPLPNSALVYTIDHTTNSFLIDQKGRLRLTVPHDMSAADVTHDLKLMIESN
jgi:protein SCO1/2